MHIGECNIISTNTNNLGDNIKNNISEGEVGKNTQNVLNIRIMLPATNESAGENGKMGSVIEILVVQSLARQTHGDQPHPLAPLERNLVFIEPEAYVRIFVDEGASKVTLLSKAAAQGSMPDYICRLPVEFAADSRKGGGNLRLPTAQALIEPLSKRELEILKLIAQGLSNREICERLFLALDTVKGHNRRIFDKLSVERRTEAIARGFELGLL